MEILSQPLHIESSTGIGSDGRNGDSRSASELHSSLNPASLSLEEQCRLMRNPVYFGQTLCTSHQYTEWQRNFLNDCRVVEDDGRFNEDEWPRTVVLAAVNGSGKTEILADVIRFLLSTVPGCVIPITSPIYRQLEMLENYLKAQNHKFPGWTCIEGKLTAPNGNFARWFATDTPTAVESFHGKFLVRIIEEAKAFPDEIFDQTNRWQPKLTIMVSSKGLTKGRLYEALTKHRQFNRVHEVDATMCHWVPKKWIDEQIAQHGRESSIIKSMIFNEFSDEGVNNLISLEQIRHCFKYPPPWRNPGFRVAGIDLSSNRINGDKTVCVVRQGNKLFEPYELPPCKTAEAIGMITNWLKREKIKIAFVDSSGHGGISMYEMLCENLQGDESIQIHGISFGSNALSEQSFCKNRATELWVEGQKKIEKLDLIFDWTEKWKSQFITEVTSREVKIMPSGERMLESKKDMNYSPDLSDATFLALQEPAYERKSITGLGKTAWGNFKDDGTGQSDKSSFGYSSSGKRFGRG